jgi:hypothetical protein
MRLESTFQRYQGERKQSFIFGCAKVASTADFRVTPKDGVAQDFTSLQEVRWDEGLILRLEV